MSKRNLSSSDDDDDDAPLLKKPKKMTATEKIQEAINILTPTQRAAVKLASLKKSFFLTGSAGTGKSLTLKAIVEVLSIQGIKTAVTASTGIAAASIAGTTIFSFMGAGLAKGKPHSMASRIKRIPTVFQRWKDTEVLIIDEISMLESNVISVLDALARILRKNPDPFGGIAVIACGDFAQLPPVRPDIEASGGKVFAFENELFSRHLSTTVLLQKIFRQQEDLKFCEMLDRARSGSMTELDHARLEAHVLRCKVENKKRRAEEMEEEKKFKIPDRLEYGKEAEPLVLSSTKLFSHCKQADAINKANLDRLPEKYERKDFPVEIERTGVAKKHERTFENFEKNIRKRHEGLRLCRGALVMMTANVDTDARLVNGARGVVVCIEGGCPVVSWEHGAQTVVKSYEWKMVLESDSRVKSVVKCIPLMLAWAVTIHKSQGATLSKVRFGLGKKIFECGQGYTALSRATSLSAIDLTEYSRESMKSHPLVVAFYKRVMEDNRRIFDSIRKAGEKITTKSVSRAYLAFHDENEKRGTLLEFI